MVKQLKPLPGLSLKEIIDRYDTTVKDLNASLEQRDREIGSLRTERIQLRTEVEDLRKQNDQLRDQMQRAELNMAEMTGYMGRMMEDDLPPPVAVRPRKFFTVQPQPSYAEANYSTPYSQYNPRTWYHR